MPNRHIEIILDAKGCIARLQRVIAVASIGGIYESLDLTGKEDWDAELTILENLMPTCSGDFETQITTLEGMVPTN